MLAVGVVSLNLFCPLGQNVNATEYNVGSGKTYTSLEELRKATIQWADGDKIILHDSVDNSLTDAFENFDGKEITISAINGTAKVSPSTSGFRFFTPQNMSSMSSDLLLTIADGSSINFEGFEVNVAFPGGAIVGKAVTISGSGTSTFTNNKVKYTGYNGGAIYGLEAVTLSGNSIFTGNEASNGGAIGSRGSVTLSGTNEFSVNKASSYGGAIYAVSDTATVTLSGINTFTGNEASVGGAIASLGNYADAVMISGTNTFTSNNATNGGGGAIYSVGNVTISGTSEFTGNTSSSYGGAISSEGNVTISGTSTFSNNTAGIAGGAIVSQGNVTITASEGDIVFTGNKLTNNSPNAITMGNGSNNTLSLAATNGNNVKFYDTILSSSSNTNLIININKEDDETGTVLFDMSSNGANRTSYIYGNTTVYKGTLALTGEAVYGAVANSGDFTLQNTATLLTTGKGNTINAKNGDVILDGTLAFKNIDQANGTLTFNTDGTITGTVNAIDILDTLTDGQRYVLATSAGSADFSSLILPTQINYNGTSIANTRAADNVLVTTDDTDKALVLLVKKLENTTVTWNGNANSNWNISDRNWSGKLANNDNVNQFLHDDNVTFSTATKKDITVNSGGVTVATMTVDADGYKFSGGQITGDSLVLNSVTNSETIFQNDIDITNTITVAQNNTLTFDYATDKTDRNMFSGTGTVKKTGSGELTLIGNNISATGMMFNQTGGTVNLPVTWGGNYTQSNGTTLILSNNNSKIGGNADLSGIVDITNGRLDVGENLDLKSGSVLKMNIAADKIVADSVNIDGEVEIDLSTLPNGQTDNVIVSNTGTLNTSQLDSRFDRSSKLLVTFQPFYSNNDKIMGLNTTSQTAEQYTTQNNFRKNQVQIAALLDGYAPIKSQLNSLDTREQMESLVKSLLAPELAADTLELPLNNPYFRVFNHVNNLRNRNSQRTNSEALFRGQSDCSPDGCTAQGNYEFWFEGYYQGGETHGDSNALSYKTSRGGMMVGVDQYFGDGLLTGLIFGYGNPRVYNSVGKVEADDYTFGAYSRLRIFGIYANAFIGYGSQNYQLRQNQINPNQHTNYNGDSFYASLELFKPINLRNDLSISPLIAIDFQKAWSDSFKTTGNIPLAVKKSNIDQTVLRIGVNTNNGIWRTRLQYGYQIAGDLHGISRTSITGGTGGNRILTGVNLGRHTLNAGLGGDFQISNRTKLFADYDLDLGKHATSHTGQFGFVRYF